MSMINEQIKRLRAMALAEHCLMHYETEELLNCAAYTIEELSAKLAIANMERSTAYYNDGWIPCSERLPEYNGYYICTVNDYSETLELVFSTLDDSWKDEFYNLYDVIAWQPKPAPYQPKGEK